jgi:hypothetical protein
MLKSVQIVFLKDISGIFIISHIRQTQCLQDLAINLLTCFFTVYSKEGCIKDMLYHFKKLLFILFGESNNV